MAKGLEASQGRRGGGVLVVADLRALRLLAELCRGEVAEGTARAAQALLTSSLKKHVFYN